MPLLRNVTVYILALYLTACSSTTTSGPDFSTPEGKLFGEYLAGTYANEIEDAKARSDY